MSGFRLDGRVALVTGSGSSRGLGRAIASALLGAGCGVALGMDVNGGLYFD